MANTPDMGNQRPLAGLGDETNNDLLTIAVYHLRLGAKTFDAFVKAMNDDLGEKWSPYHKELYEKIRSEHQIQGMDLPQKDQTIPAKGLTKEQQRKKNLLLKAWEFRKQHPNKPQPRLLKAEQQSRSDTDLIEKLEPHTEKEYRPTTPLTVLRAKKIVGYAEKDFAAGSQIKDAFVPFAQGGASTRFEALCALYLVIADTYRFAMTPQGRSQNAITVFENYAEQSWFIAVLIMTDGLLEGKAEKETRTNRRIDHESTVAYIKSLDSNSSEFWPQVYKHIGLNYPDDNELIPEGSFINDDHDQSSLEKKLSRWEKFKSTINVPFLFTMILVLLAVAFFVAADFDKRSILIPIALYMTFFMIWDVKKK